MKKSIISILLCILLSIFTVFNVSCAEEIDYTKEELTIKTAQRFDSCYFFDFLYNNEHTTAFFEEIISQMSFKATGWVVIINGEKWAPTDLARDELPYGIYKITIETPEGTHFVVWDAESSSYIQQPYHKKLTMTVSIMPFYEDVYGTTNNE